MQRYLLLVSPDGQVKLDVLGRAVSCRVLLRRELLRARIINSVWVAPTGAQDERVGVVLSGNVRLRPLRDLPRQHGVLRRCLERLACFELAGLL